MNKQLSKLAMGSQHFPAIGINLYLPLDGSHAQSENESLGMFKVFVLCGLRL